MKRDFTFIFTLAALTLAMLTTAPVAVFASPAALPVAAATYDIPLSAGSLIVTPNRDDTVIGLTIPVGTWTNYSLTTDWSASPSDNTFSHIARWELVPANYTQPYYSPSLGYVWTEFAASGAYSDRRDTTIHWAGVLNHPLVSDGMTTVYFRAQQSQRNYGVTVSAPTGNATWTSPILTLSNAPLTQTAFAGSLENTDPVTAAFEPNRAWYNPDNPPPTFDAEDKRTWSDFFFDSVMDGGPADRIPFHVTADGYYHVDLNNGGLSDGGADFPGQLGIYQTDNPDFAQDDQSLLLDYDIKWAENADAYNGTDNHSVDAFLQAGVQYYLLYGARIGGSSDIEGTYSAFQRDYTGTIEGLTGTAVLGVVPEPTSLALLGLGGVMLLSRKRRGRHA